MAEYAVTCAGGTEEAAGHCPRWRLRARLISRASEGAARASLGTMRGAAIVVGERGAPPAHTRARCALASTSAATLVFVLYLIGN